MNANAWTLRAWPRYVDAVTGEQVSGHQAGAVFQDVVMPYSVSGSSEITWVPVPANKVGRKTFTYAVKDGFGWADVARIGAKMRADQKAAKKAGRKRPTKKQKIPGVTETYRNAGDAADLFLSQNSAFIETTGYTGAEDQIRDFIDGFEVRRGRARKDGTYAFKRLNTTAKGREILDAFKDDDYAGAREFLVWLFSKNRGKRWADVDWGAVDGLGDILAETCGDTKAQSRDGEMSCTGWIWYPPAAGLQPLKERLQDLTPKAAAQLENQTHAAKLKALVKELRAALKKAAPCLPPQTQDTIRERIAYLAKLAKESWRIPGSTICGADPESGYQFCGFPAIASEVAQLRKACEFGYDPNWPLAEGLSENAAAEFGLPTATATGEARPLDIEGQPVSLEDLDAIPWATEENPGGARPPSPGTLDDDGRRMLWTVYEAAKKHYSKQGERGAQLKQLAARVAWSEVKRHYFKRGAKWQRRKHVLPREPDALDLRQGSLSLANPAKYRPIRWKVIKHTTPLDRMNKKTRTEHRGDGYTFTVYTGNGKKRIGAVRRYNFPEEILKGGAGYSGGDFKTMTAAKAAANKHRRAYLKASKKDGSKANPPRELTKSVRSNPSPRNPFGDLLDLRARVVELEVEIAGGLTQVHTWNKDRPALFWSETKRALVWVHGGRDPVGFVDADVRGAVASRHRKWHGTDPTELGQLELPAGPLAKLGRALRIVYFAERYPDGRPRHHDFAAGVGAYAQKGRGARVFECRGGRLTLNDRGLVF